MDDPLNKNDNQKNKNRFVREISFKNVNMDSLLIPQDQMEGGSDDPDLILKEG